MTTTAKRHRHSHILTLSLLLTFSILLTSHLSNHHPPRRHNTNPLSTSCNYSNGKWIYDETLTSPRYNASTCKEIYKGWDCLGSGKSNAVDVFKWRWKPHQCVLSELDPVLFFNAYRDTSIGFVGDSLNRNMFISFFCTLKQVSGEVKKWRPAGADRGFTFLKYNLTVAYHRTNLLARYGRWSANDNDGKLATLGYKEGYRIDVDVPERTWAEAPTFHDILIFNTGHWWCAPSKFDPAKSPMLFFENDLPVVPPISPDAGLDLVLRYMISYVEARKRPGAILLFRTQSPRHFEGRDWDTGGSCQRFHPLLPQQVEAFFPLENNGTNMEARFVNVQLHKALKGTSFSLLDITNLSEFRADAHPSTTGGKKHDDCMHWCLPGITDTWNDLFITELEYIKRLDEELKVTRQVTRFENWPVILSISKLAFPLRNPLKGLTKAPYHIDLPASEDFLDLHNKARAEVGVAPLRWNDTVAAYAQNYAIQRAEDCKLQHSGGAYGENIAEASWNLSPIEAVKMWVDEKPFFDYSSNKCNGGDCLHYTQVVWRNSVNVGCAKVQCKNNLWYFVTCNYDPPGNFVGERPY